MITAGACRCPDCNRKFVGCHRPGYRQIQPEPAGGPAADRQRGGRAQPAAPSRSEAASKQHRLARWIMQEGMPPAASDWCCSCVLWHSNLHRVGRMVHISQALPSHLFVLSCCRPSSFSACSDQDRTLGQPNMLSVTMPMNLCTSWHQIGRLAETQALIDICLPIDLVAIFWRCLSAFL